MNSKDIVKILEIFKFEKNKLKNKNILITGAFGFIGKYILDTLISIQENYHIQINIYAVDNFITSNVEHIENYKDKNIKCINHNIIDPLNIDTEFDYIICLAGIASPYYYNKFPLETLSVSINGLNNMFNLNHNNNTKFIFFSSSEVYGDPSPENIPTKESYRGNVTSVGPRSCYDESKRVGETICYIQSEKFNKNTTIIRPFNVYGPGMNVNDYRIIPNITRSILTNEKLKIYDTGTQTRTYCYVVDAINGFLRAIIDEDKFSIFNIGNDIGEISVLDLVKTSEKVLGDSINYEITPYPEEYPADQPQRRCPDLSNAKNKLNYQPIITLEEGLKNHFYWSKQENKI